MTQGVNEQIGILPAIEAKFHLFEIGRKMLCADTVPRPHDATLQETESGFDCVGVNVAIYVDAAFVLDGLVLLCGDARLLRFDVVLPPSASLTGSAGEAMTVDAFTSSLSGTGIGGSTVTPTVLNLGATLHVGANQEVGTYSGTFTVTVVRE